MELKELVGEHVLRGIDRATISQDGEALRFDLDGTVYEVSENAADGYRSYHNPLHAIKGVKLANSFPGVPVIIEHTTVSEYDSDYNGSDILVFRTASEGQEFLRVGTDDIDDYYPSWVCEFSAASLGTIQD